MMDGKWLIYFLLIISANNSQQASMSCSYGGRGSLTSICNNANAAYFRKTSYRFDNLDETVRCVGCNLQVIESGTFDLSGNQIKYLDLENSQITVLKPKSFIGLIFLRILNLKSNHIGIIPPETFQGVTKIEQLNLKSNSIASLVANGFKELSSLVRLNLANNQIKDVEMGSFNGLDKLEELNLANNEISNVGDVFKGLVKVASIRLEGNKVSQIDPFDLKDLNELTELNLAKNNLKYISKNTFLQLHRLESLNLSANPIEVIELGGFRGLASLEDLDLSSCLISEIQKGLLSTLHQLRILNLSFNRLAVFKTGVFSGLPELRALNISHNKIGTFEKTGVFNLHNLHILDLSFNNLKNLDYKMLVNHLPSVSHIGLENNPWPCYLKKEMEELFKHDNLVFDLGATIEETCNDSRPVDISTETIPVGSTESMLAYVPSSGGHAYLLYVFMFFSIVVISVLFYLQYVDKREIGRILGTSDAYETRLITN